MPDHEIVAAIVAGDPAGLAAAYDTYAAALHAYCRSLLAEPADAADAVQDTFVITAAKVGDLRAPDRLRPWLYAVARNECHRRLRGQARVAALDEAGDVTDNSLDPSSRVAQAELRELVTAALAGLNPGDREVIELNLRHEVEGADLAEAFGVPLNQAHALASRARGQLERSLGALLVARTGRPECAELDAILADWDGTLTVLMRKRVSRHIEGCQVCSERRRRVLSPAALFSVLPIVGLPPGLRHQVLRLVSDNSPAAIRYRTEAVSRVGQLTGSGFPVQISPAVRVRKHGIRAHPALYAAGVAIILLGGGGPAAYALKHKHSTADARPAVTVTITVPAKPTATTAHSTPAPTATTTVPVVVTASPSPVVSPGTLQVSPTVVKLSPSPSASPIAYTYTFTLTAEGGPVTYSISVPSSEQPYLILTPTSGSLQAGQQQQITVTVSATATPNPPYYNTATVNPRDILVTIYYPPSG